MTVVNTTPLAPNATPSFEVRRKTEAGWETILKIGNREFAHLVSELGPQELVRRANAYDAAVSALSAHKAQEDKITALSAQLKENLTWLETYKRVNQVPDDGPLDGSILKTRDLVYANGTSLPLSA